MITERIYYQHIRNIGVASVLLNETEMVGLDFFAAGIAALPAPLIDLKYQAQSILHDWMIYFSLVYPLGIHTTAAYRAVMETGFLFQFDSPGSGRFPDRDHIDPGIFNIEQFYDIIVHTVILLS